MKSLLLFFLCLIFNFSLSAQPVSGGKGNTYALVVGISTYSDADIPQLQYANRDAEIFADYLKSPAGGAVPAENIQLLVNEQATSGTLYNAIYQLRKTCSKGDLVYFYFSGHGDLENVTMYKNGFLICYNSPSTNYVGFAFSIEYLNEIANTLSVETQANVVLITDACHSGKLAGSNFKGNQFVGEQLRAVKNAEKNKEIRITSCNINQLSNENAEWGGGRGVFSYYLVNGLKGLADKQKDGIVTLDEIKVYLDSSFKKDAILNREKITQTPVLIGNGNFALAKVDTAAMKLAENEIAEDINVQLQFAPPIAPSEEDGPAQPQEYFFHLLKKKSLEEIIKTGHLDQTGFNADVITDNVLNDLIVTLKTDEARNKLVELYKTLHENKSKAERFNNRLAIAFDDAGQAVINQYLDGDAAELEKRRYYNIKNTGYDVYKNMFAVALMLTSADNNDLRNILKVKMHYFGAVAARLNIPLVENPAKLINTAWKEINEALKLEKTAPYIYNELGNVQLLKKQTAAAEKNYYKAIELSPTWAIPWSNLAGIYINAGKFDKGLAMLDSAKARQPNLQDIETNYGVINYKKGNLLFAEELFRKAIKLNTRFYLPFENLGFVYNTTTQYALADSFYFEAELRKRGYHFNYPFVSGPGIPFNKSQEALCPFDEKDVDKNDAIAQFALGKKLFDLKVYDEAEEHFKIVIALDKNNPLAFHYLGKLLYQQKRWQEGEIILKMALENYLLESDFNSYVGVLKMTYAKANPSANCFILWFEHSYYSQVEDNYLIAGLYEQWNHFAEAEEQYRYITKNNSADLGGYIKLWSLMERLGRYDDAENFIKEFTSLEPEAKEQPQKQGDQELNAFYKRMIIRFPEKGMYYYKEGKLLYNLAVENKYGETYNEIYIKKKESENKALYTAPDISLDSGKNNYGINEIILPGSEDTVYKSWGIQTPYSEQGIEYLKKADSLLNEDGERADINNKIGDFYWWLGLPDDASKHYFVAVNIQPDNAGTREKLVNCYNAAYLYQDALTQLDSLYRRKEINFPKQLMLARYKIHSGLFAEAQTLLDAAEKVHPYIQNEIIDLNGRLQLLSQNPKKALEYYTQLLDRNPNDSMVMYSIARLYAKRKNDNEALKWLQKSLKNGFNYSFVLKYDPYMKDLRKSPKWNSLTKGIAIKQYQDLHEGETF